jgi:D-tyrosyl-tRNA(Tyr) deacylase
MRALVQRVREASVTVDGHTTGAIGAGLLVLVGIAGDDGAQDRDWLVRKLAQLRIFDDDEGVMNRAIVDTGGDILAVSQFTLYASTRKGNRPSYTAAARPEGRGAGVRRVRRVARRHAGQAGSHRRVRRAHASAPRQRWSGDNISRLACANRVTGSGFAAARAICARSCQKHSALRAPCFCPDGS